MHKNEGFFFSAATITLGLGSTQFHIPFLLEASLPGVTEMKCPGMQITTHLHLELKEFTEMYLCSSIHVRDIVLNSAKG
jgi:hypothetical protein